MQQVVDEAGLDWLDTPDQAVVWGTALGLQGEIEDVLQRSLEDVKQGRTTASVALLPDLVPDSSGGVASRARPAAGQRRQPLLGLGHPRHRRDDVGARDDRELAGVVRRRRWRRVRRRLVGRRRRRRRRRLLGAVRRGRPWPRRPNRSRQPVEALDRDRRPRPGAPASRRSSGTAGWSRGTPSRRQARRARSPRSRARARPRSTARCRGTPRSRRPARQAVEGEPEHRRRASPCREPRPWNGAEPRPGVDRPQDREPLRA